MDKETTQSVQDLLARIQVRKRCPSRGTPAPAVQQHQRSSVMNVLLPSFYDTSFMSGYDVRPGLVCKEIDPMQYGMKYKSGQDLNGLYILWCPTSPEVPSYIFPDRPAAIKASVAMANRFHGQEFAVCKIVGTTKPAGVRFEGDKE